MNEKLTCPRCGNPLAAGSQYCAHCGRSLVRIPARIRLAGFIRQLLDGFSPRAAGVAILVAAVLAGIVVEELIFSTILGLGLSYVLIGLVVGLGSGYAGWTLNTPQPNHTRALRTLVALGCMVLVLIAIAPLDDAIVNGITSSGRTVTLDMPGLDVMIPAKDPQTGGLLQRLVVGPRLPYWLFTTLYALLAAALGNRVGGGRRVVAVREQHVRDLRESLVAQTRAAAAQEERNRLARELHDSIKQQLFSIHVGAAAAQARWENDPAGAREAVEDVRQNAQEAMAEVNALLQQLSPAPLEKVGLVQALRDQCEALGYRTGAEVAVEIGDLPGDDLLPAGAQESLFRIAQEASSNVARHARAHHVRLRLGRRGADGPLEMVIEDDGQGFDPAETSGGMGLDNIRQRARALGGRFSLDSAPGKGTVVRVSVPPALPEEIGKERNGRRHPLNRAILAGLAGGLALAAALFYPLYVLVPGRVVEGWPGGSPAIGLALGGAAALLAGLTGFLAARWSRGATRQQGALLGALGGGVAGAVLFFVIGAAAAAITGGGILLERGLIPATGRDEVIRLLAGTTAGAVWWQAGAFWAALLTGAGLGAAGGLLPRPAPAPDRQADAWTAARSILTVSVIAGALALVASVGSLALIEPTLRQGLAANGLSLEPPYVLDRLSDLLVGTPALLYTVPLVALTLLLRAEVRAADEPGALASARAAAQLLALVSLAVPVYLLAASHPVLPKGSVWLPAGWLDVTGLPHAAPASLWEALGWPLPALLIGGGLALGALNLRLVHQANRRQRAMGKQPPPLVQTLAVLSLLLTAGLLDWAFSLSLSHAPGADVVGALVAVAVIGIDVFLVVKLLRAPRQPRSRAGSLARLRLAATRSANVAAGAIVALAVPLMPTLSIDVGLGLITNQLVEVLVGMAHAAQEFTVASLVQGVYLAQAGVALVLLVASVALVGLLVLVISGIIGVVELFGSRNGGSP